MVTTLHLLELISDICIKLDGSLGATHYQELLAALQASYWHARSFNEDQALRSALGSRSFMSFPEASTLLPHLLEQEAGSTARIVEISMRLYVLPESGSPLSSVVEPWIRRYVYTVAEVSKIHSLCSHEPFPHYLYQQVLQYRMLALHGF